ncbi:MAG: nucleotidyltransferase domain-containing protein, partial [Rhizobacter sp.]|nr:nucleotidyltransferase domain-containing protein [Chlorobiales bacterium]
MKTLDDIRRVLQTEQPRLHERYGLKVLGIFGSYSRGEQTPESDVDILVEFDGEKQLTIFDDLYIAEYLAEKLGIK